MSQHRSTPLAALAATLLFWSSAFVAIRIAIPSFDPGAMALLRFLIASLAIAAWVAARRRAAGSAPEGSWRIARRDLPGLLLLGATGVAGYHLLLNAGERTVSAGNASLLICTAPVWTVILARLLLGERLELRALAGVAIAFAGVAWVSMGEAEGSLWSPGALMVSAAALIQGLFFTVQKLCLGRYAPLPLTAWAIWLGTALLLPWAPRLAADLARAPLPAILAVVYLGVFPTAIAYFTWTHVLSRTGAARATSLLFLVPPLAVAMGWLLLGETPGAAALGGGVLTLAGVLLVQRRAAARRPVPARGARHPASPLEPAPATAEALVAGGAPCGESCG